MKSFQDCKYSVFISYAHEDDEAEDGWVARFAEQLHKKLLNRLRQSEIDSLQQMHLSGRNGPVSGSLGDVLLANVADSYAMVIVVHNRYMRSEWCLQELAYFRKVFQEAGLAERLFIVAMSEAAMNGVEAKPQWRELTLPNQVWIPFYTKDQPRKPAPAVTEEKVPSRHFLTQLDKLLEAMETSITQSVRQGRTTVSRALPPLAQPAPSGAGARLLFGVPSPELADAVQAVADQLRARGVPVDLLDHNSLTSFTEFDAAHTLVLAFGSGGSYVAPHEYVPGGHLAVQRNAWLRKKRPADGLHWLDLRASTAELTPEDGHEALVEQVAGQALSPEALLARFAPAPKPDERAAPPAGTTDRIHIYIESPQGEDVDVWQDLGERIRTKWDTLVDSARREGDPSIPQLELRPRGLSLERFSKGDLDDADGVVLLWGSKDEEALYAQVAKVDGSLAKNPPPGVVAYLMPQQQRPEQSPMQPRYWSVLQFDNARSDAIDIVPAESERLDRFLKSILKRYKLKRGASAIANPGAQR